MARRHRAAVSDAAPPLESLLGLGPTTSDRLRAVGIGNRADLERAGAVGAFLLLKHAGHRPTKNALWALHGALEGQHWAGLSSEEKARLLGDLQEAEG